MRQEPAPRKLNASVPILLALLAAAPSGLAQPRPLTPQIAQVVVVLDTRGKVDVLKGARRLTARVQEPLATGDAVQTSTNSHANLRWYDLMPFQLSELSHLVIPPPPAAGKPSRFEVLKGLLYFFHRGRPGAFEVQTPTATAVVLGTEFSIQVEPNGRTVILLFDGQVDLSSAGQTERMNSGQQGVVDPGLPPVVTPILQAVNDLIQWFLYYPGVLDADEAGLTSQEEQPIGASLAAYRRGDLRDALAQYPPGRQPASDAERIYFAALLLSVGQVNKAEALLDALTPAAGRQAPLAAAMRKLIFAVKGRTDPSTLNAQLATCLLADSYYQQSRADLPKALVAATNAVQRAPQFGFAWARVAELQFSFGRTHEALFAVERALQLSPRNAQALALKGFLLAAENRIRQATEFFDQAIELDGGLGNAWLGRGLCRIHHGQEEAGREDLLVAAACEPQRALLRSYLGKAFSQAGDNLQALKELHLAQTLDGKDPTVWLYLALIKQQENQINEAVRALEKSQQLNKNRRLYRSRLLLDQDRAVRSANLASVYQDAGMIDVAARQAARAVNADYANFSAHLFLANSFDALRDPNQINLRYDTPWFSEYLLANLLAPAGAGTLSPQISQQEYARLFERDRVSLSSQTEYLSQGNWTQLASQYGNFGNSSYAIDVDYRSRNGHRPNNDQEQLTTFVRFKQQLTAADSVFLQGINYNAEAGDPRPYYDQRDAQIGLRVEERQEPVLLAGYHREWSPSSHTLLLAGRLQNTLELTNPTQQVLYLRRETDGTLIGAPNLRVPTAALDYRNEFEAYTAEGQQIWTGARHSVILGARFQIGEFDTRSRLGTSGDVQLGDATETNPPPFTTRAVDRHFITDFQRLSFYGYHVWQVAEPLLLSAGVSYDQLRHPVNFRSSPTSGEEDSADQLSPKAGFIWTPSGHTTVRAAYTRSLGGVSFDQSFQLEPSQVAGFNQSYRSLIPESVEGPLTAARIESTGISLEQKLGSGTYFGAQAEWFRSDADRFIGVDNIFFSGPGTLRYEVSATRRRLDYEERNLILTLNQLVDDHWSFGARYRLSDADLRTDLVAIPDRILRGARSHSAATLHQLILFALFQHECGFFGEFESIWTAQDNRADLAPLRGDEFWQFDIFAGYRFPRRRAELRVGLLNLTDQDYQLYPLNLMTELPRERTLAVSFRFNF